MNYILAGFISGAIVALWSVGGIYFLACSTKRKIRKESYLTKNEIAELEKASRALKQIGKLDDVDVEGATKALDRIVYDSDLKQVII